MELMNKIKNDMIIARRNGDKISLSTLTMAWSALGLKAKEKKVEALSDADTQTILQTMIKQRKDSIEQFTKGGRQDLVGQEEREIVILETYLPKEASDEDISAAVTHSKIILFGKSGVNPNIGEMMKECQRKLSGLGYRVDGKKLSVIVKEALG